MSERGLTHKQTLFIEHYLGDARGNGCEAARLAGYAGDTNTLNQMAMANLQHPTIASRVRETLAEAGMTREAILNSLAEIVSIPNAAFFSAGRDSKASLADKVRALELLGKFHRLFVDRQETQTTSTQRIEIVSIEAVRTIDSVAGSAQPRLSLSRTVSTDSVSTADEAEAHS